MLETYFPLAIILAFAIFIGVLVVILGTIFGPHRPTERKSAPYESGMIPYGPGARRMNVKFYLVAVLFILFDIEIVFVLPWAVIFRELGVPGLILMGIFLVVLEVAFVYAWKKGALEWE
jgi:NADH-quinone oxidoreductase subunit A